MTTGNGCDPRALNKLGGLYRGHPIVAFLFLIPALSLAGIPPFSGFFAKLSLIEAGLEVRSYWIVATALAVGMLTLFSMMKIWHEVFWKPAPGRGPSRAPGIRVLLIPVALLALLTVGMGLGAEGVFALSARAAHELLDPTIYRAAVL